MRRRRAVIRLGLRYVAACAVTAVFLFPIYWLFTISFKTADEIFAFPPVWWPGSLNFANYYVLFKDGDVIAVWNSLVVAGISTRSEDTSELQSLMRISYAVFCLKKKKTKHNRTTTSHNNIKTQTKYNQTCN